MAYFQNRLSRFRDHQLFIRQESLPFSLARCNLMFGNQTSLVWHEVQMQFLDTFYEETS